MSQMILFSFETFYQLKPQVHILGLVKLYLDSPIQPRKKSYFRQTNIEMWYKIEIWNIQNVQDRL